MINKIKGHIHAEIMAEYAEVAKTNPKPWEEFQYDMGNYIWYNLNKHPKWNVNYTYRRKPKTIRIGEYDVPEPLKVKPEYGATYYTIYFDHSCYNKLVWIDDDDDEYNYQQGLAHATKEAAILHAEAILSFTKKGE